ncbi:MAG: polysaccharide deacetylase family protein [Oscillospiraceae bacterium]|jgi:peptidoglycan/xylan/chitin deacetylase (PgdA/CDA1 family)
MDSKKWLLSFAGAGLLVALLIALLNAAVDPFGVFGDRLFQWHSANATINPRTAKIAYLKENFDRYDSYLVGSSSTAAYSVEKLNQYLNASFYNTFAYGSDMRDMEATVRYLIENDEVKNIVLSLSLSCAAGYDWDTGDLTGIMHADVDGSSKFLFYVKYLFANPMYSFSKIYNYLNDTYLPQPFDVFLEETGAYDKSVRDSEPIGDLGEYLAQNSSFTQIGGEVQSLEYIEEYLNALKAIVERCRESGVNLIVIFEPTYTERFKIYDWGQVREMLEKTAEITDFWCFSFNSVCEEPRYLYDVYHVRNPLGELAISRIFGDGSKMIPPDFGVLLTAENVSGYLDGLGDMSAYAATLSAGGVDDSGYTARVPILLYHHIARKGDGKAIISRKLFEEQIRTLHNAGYTTVTILDLIEYVEKGREFPEKPVVITFDDGYLSNYEIAYPILKKYNMKATIFVIGVSMGKSTYKDTGIPIYPHFSEAQAAEMVSSGLISIQSHSYDMHQYPDYEESAVRENVLIPEGEKEEEYIEHFRRDLELSRAQIEAATGEPVYVFSFPHGDFETLSGVLLREAGFRATVTTVPKSNTIIKCLPQSLYELGRFNVTEDISPEELLAMISE